MEAFYQIVLLGSPYYEDELKQKLVEALALLTEKEQKVIILQVDLCLQVNQRF